ncbi:MAG: FHA domain-containing protein [Bacteroidota bacterium]
METIREDGMNSKTCVHMLTGYTRRMKITCLLSLICLIGLHGIFAQEAEDTETFTFDIHKVDADETRKRLVIEFQVETESGILSEESINGTTISISESMGTPPNLLHTIDMGIEEIVSIGEGTYQIRLVPPSTFPDERKVYNGEIRTITVSSKYGDAEDSESFSLGTPSNPINFKDIPWLVVILTGMLIVTGFLILLSIMLPGLTKLQFKRKYVRKYKDIKEEGRRKMDPITSEAFMDDELVVTRCEQWHSLESWQYNHYQCVNYPGCQNRAVPCTDGENIQAESYQFFTQQGKFKNLNWLWFGSLGGLISWGAWAILTNIAIVPYMALMSNLAPESDYQLARDSMMGFSLGLGLVFALAWVEERGQSSEFSWLRIIIKAFIGGILSLLVFLGGFLIYRVLGLENEYLGGLISWGLFGVFLGIILSIRSTIEITRGILGGLIAGIIAYNIFFGLSFLSDALEMAKVIAFVVLGAVLGIIVVTVVSQLEDFELEYISPVKYSRVNPISKWLKAEMDIFIGSDSSCYVFVKWPDEEVQPKHAKLSYDGSAVYLEPYAETLIGNRILPLNKPYELKHGDIIQLGRSSISRMKFIAKSLEG